MSRLTIVERRKLRITFLVWVYGTDIENGSKYPSGVINVTFGKCGVASYYFSLILTLNYFYVKRQNDEIFKMRYPIQMITNEV